MFTQTARQTEVEFVPEVTREAPASFIKPEWWDDIETFNTTNPRLGYDNNCRYIVKAFVEGKLNKKIKGCAMNGRHSYTVKNQGTELWLFKNNPAIKVSVCVARKVNGFFLGNASSLRFAKPAGAKRVHATGSGGRLKIQEVLAECMPMVPFQLFKDSQMDINSMTIIEKGPDEFLELGRKVKGVEVKTHYTGAMVFKIDFLVRSRGIQGQKDEYFIFDIDRNDLKLKNLNFFLSRLSRPVTGLKDAYDSLKPKEVLDAERFLGQECPRQGEWFFIPIVGEFDKEREKVRNWAAANGEKEFTTRDVAAVLSAHGNRPHYVEKLSVEGYVKGKVTHGGHEHKPIELDVWHKPVPNTATKSFKISGAVD
jgi:hypothetical protein